MRDMHGLNSNPGQEKGLLQERRKCVYGTQIGRVLDGTNMCVP